MPTPFPGMAPYLERRGLWEEVHTGLIAEIQQFLAPRVRPRYRVAVARRAYLAVLSPNTLVGKPDVLVVSPARETVQATSAGSPSSGDATSRRTADGRRGDRALPGDREVETGDVVTVIEILSHSNKTSHQGREQYERKRLTVLASLTNLVEIDLLRAGDPLPMRVSGNGNPCDYRIVVSRSWHRPQADAYLFGVRDLIPDASIPLRSDENEPVLALNQIVHDL